MLIVSGPVLLIQGITLHITALWHLPNLPCHNTLWHNPMNPEERKTMLQSSRAAGQWRSRWLVVSPYLLHMQHQSIIIIQRFLRLSTVRNFPKTAVQSKKLMLVGALGFHKLLQGEEQWGVDATFYNRILTSKEFHEEGFH